MVAVSPPPPALSPEVVSLFYTTDELLSRSPVLVFYGPSSTTTASANNSRIQAHVLSPAGLQSFPRITVAPSSPLYAAVDCLPREEQGDEICRGLAFSLFKYFSELPATVKETWEKQPTSLGRLPSAPALFSDAHAAILASRMVKVEDVSEVIQDVRSALAEQSLSWLDVDLVLPPGSMKEPLKRERESTSSEETEEDIDTQRYGEYASLVKLFGEPSFLPTPKMRRAPSRHITSINRSMSFTRKQKESLRREMCELLDTEESYVGKLYDLVHSVAEDFREKAKNQVMTSASPSAHALQGLFPPSLDQILETNTKFLEAMRLVLEESEDDALKDIEATTESQDAALKAKLDVTGTLGLSKCLLTWFPKFADCYGDYIQAHAEFNQFLKIFTKEAGSSFSKRVQETGEQRLMSMLIEPVQRLPRYNLYIDNIVKQLPIKHPALRSLLKARDIITEICSRDSASSTEQAKVIDRLKRCIPSWPKHSQPQGRLIAAMDVAEVPPPYRSEAQGIGSVPGIMLLFTDYLILLRKWGEDAISARSLLAEVNGANPLTSKVTDDGASNSDIEFRQQMNLSSVDFTELDDGKMVQLVYLRGSTRLGGLALSNGDAGVRMFRLAGVYEGKSPRWLEEVVKAKVEGRFSEAERESHKWEVRSAKETDFGLLTALFEEGEGQAAEGRRAPARVRIVIDPEKGSRVIEPGEEGIEVAASLTAAGDGFYRLEINGLGGPTRDHLTAVEFLPVLTKRLSNVLQLRNQIKNPAMTATLLLRNQQILQSLSVRAESTSPEDTQERGVRPNSPVKILSSIFGGVASKDAGSLRRTHHATLSMNDIPRMLPSAAGRADVYSGRPAAQSAVNVNTVSMAASQFDKLEETLASYILALHARKGNFVGRVLRSRSSADELAVNELYNSLLEDPNNHQVAAQAPIDVLFAAFEKFAHVAWEEKIGPVISRYTLRSVQAKSDNLKQGDFEEYFRLTYEDLSPQNQRALKAIIKLLAELLEGTGNDGDRGALTAAFAEVLVPKGNAHDFISLLDRFVEDVEALFHERVPSQHTYAHDGGILASETRNRSTNTGPISSNTSSLRKRFGLTLSRENSKSESESKAGSVWRTLSKSRGGDSQPSSVSKATLSRSNSTDVNRLSARHPPSRDRPTVLGAFAFEQTSTLGTIGENQTIGPPKKKRRSSLSDLGSLQASPHVPNVWQSPATPRRPDATRQTSASPRTPSPSKPCTIPTLSPSPALTSPTLTRLGSPLRKENSSAFPLPRQYSTLKACPTSTASPTKTDEVTVTSYAGASAKRRTDSISNIPTLKPGARTTGLSERPTAGNIARAPSVAGEKPTPLSPTSTTAINGSNGANGAAGASPARRLRMQSPQKLRERLQTEQRAIDSASAGLQAELSKIGEEMAAAERAGVGSRAARYGTQQSSHSSSSASTSTSTSTSSSASATAAAPPTPNSSLSALSAQLHTMTSTLHARLAAISADVTSSLAVSEVRAKKLDELYREASAENEALYARFNDELARVLKGVRAGPEAGVDEMRRKLREAEEESARLGRENWRLKREVGGLRAQLRE